MFKSFIYISSIILILNLVSCAPPDQPANGPEDEIFIVADSTEYNYLEPSLDSAFEKVIYTPQPENIFTIKRISPNQLESFRHKKNLVIAAPLNSRSVTSQFINAIMDTASKEKVTADSSICFNKYNLWAKDQLVMILTAPTLEDLRYMISNNKDDLLYSFQQISDKRLYQCLYSPSYEQKDIEGMLLKNYGWIIYVQKDYKIASNNAAHNFVWFKCSSGKNMQKWIFVHWIENASPNYLNADSIRSIRNRLTENYLKIGGDSSHMVIAEKYFTTNEIKFKGRYAILTQGLWDLDSRNMGPFINYAFYDEASKRIYMLDGSLFAPEYYKRNLIHQMDVILQSFMTSTELDKDRREDLLQQADNLKPVSE